MLLRDLGVRRQVVPRDDAVDILRRRACPGDPIPNCNNVRLRGTTIGTCIGHENMRILSSPVCCMHGSGPTFRMKNMHALETAACLTLLEGAGANGAHVIINEDDGHCLHWRR